MPTITSFSNFHTEFWFEKQAPSQATVGHGAPCQPFVFYTLYSGFHSYPAGLHVLAQNSKSQYYYLSANLTPYIANVTVSIFQEHYFFVERSLVVCGCSF